MDIEADPGDEAGRGERTEAALQEAIDATATRYTRDPDIDVEGELRRAMSARGITVENDEWFGEVAHQIRSGHHTQVWPPDVP